MERQSCNESAIGLLFGGKEIMPTIGQLLKDARNKAGLNQAAAAEASGVSQGKISEYESDKGNPTLETLQLLATAYKTTVSKLTRGLE